MVDLSYPRASEEELPDLYTELDRMISVVDETLREQFPTQERGGITVVHFDTASTEVYLDAMWKEPDTMVAFFQKVTGFSDRELERQYGFKDVGSRLRGRTTDFRDEEEAIEFAEVIKDHMPAELQMETLLYAFVKLSCVLV
jgi:hypothetical protein